MTFKYRYNYSVIEHLGSKWNVIEHIYLHDKNWNVGRVKGIKEQGTINIRVQVRFMFVLVCYEMAQWPSTPICQPRVHVLLYIQLVLMYMI